MASTSAEKHFEGLDEATLRRRRTLIGVGIAAIAALLFFFAKSTLPSMRTEFVGKWYAGPNSRSLLDIHPDGTYTSLLRLDQYSANAVYWFRSEGTWRATHETLYMTPKKIESEGFIPDKRTFKALRDRMANHESRLRVTWNSPDSINANEVENESFTRGSKAP